MILTLKVLTLNPVSGTFFFLSLFLFKVAPFFFSSWNKLMVVVASELKTCKSYSIQWNTLWILMWSCAVHVVHIQALIMCSTCCVHSTLMWSCAVHVVYIQALMWSRASRLCRVKHWCDCCCILLQTFMKKQERLLPNLFSWNSNWLYTPKSLLCLTNMTLLHIYTAIKPW